MDEKVEKYNGNMRKGTSVMVFIMGALFAFFSFSEYRLATNENITWNAKFACLITVISIICGAIFVVFVKLIHAMKKKTQYHFTGVNKQIPSGYAFGGSFLFTVLAWLPFYLAYYPGICAYDATIQFGQIFNQQYNSHHPLFHTLFIEGCINLGEFFFHSQNAGIGIQTFIQMILLALSFAYMLFVLTKMGMKLVGQIICQLLFMSYCLNWYMVVSVTKDVLFTAFLIVFLSSLYFMRKDNSIKTNIVMLVGGVGLCLFRNNGMYALAFAILALVVSFIINKSNRSIVLKQVIEYVIIVGVSSVLLHSVSSRLNADSGDKREMLSVPIQQIARTAVNHGKDLTEDEQSFIDEFILNQGYLEYNPLISDPVKNNTNTSVVRYQIKRFTKMYFGLLAKYPSDYINAFLGLVGGYVSPFDKTFMYDETGGEKISREYIRFRWTHNTGDYGDNLYEESKIPLLKEKLDNYAMNDSYYVPILKWMYIPGLLIWIYLGVFIFAYDRGKDELVIPLIFVAGFYVTILLGPTMNMRYIFPLIAVLPLFAGGVLCRSNS